MSDGEKRISGIGGLDNGSAWAMSRPEAAAFITGGEKSFFVLGPNGRSVEVEAVQGGFANGSPWFYLQTQSDQDPSNNLLALPDCTSDGYALEIWY